MQEITRRSSTRGTPRVSCGRSPRSRSNCRSVSQNPSRILVLLRELDYDTAFVETPLWVLSLKAQAGPLKWGHLSTLVFQAQALSTLSARNPLAHFTKVYFDHLQPIVQPPQTLFVCYPEKPAFLLKRDPQRLRGREDIFSLP